MSNGPLKPCEVKTTKLSPIQEFLEATSGNWLSAATPEPEPVKNDHPAIADVVAAEMIRFTGGSDAGREVARDVMARKAFGMKKYGTPLQPFNGRDTTNDLYQELVDALKYARVLMYEASYANKLLNAHLKMYEDLQRLTLTVKELGPHGYNTSPGR